MVTVEDSFVSAPRARVMQAVNYATSINPRPRGPGNWRQLAQLYWYYAPQFGMDPLLPWAQMLHETGARTYGGAVDPYANNYAGIGATGGPNGGLAFRTPQYGVLGHLVHLATYIFTGPVNKYCTKRFDPRLAFWDGAPLLRHLVRTQPEMYQGRLLPERRWANPGDGYAAALALKATNVQNTSG
jgi:hypothetical protein